MQLFERFKTFGPGSMRPVQKVLSDESQDLHEAEFFLLMMLALSEDDLAFAYDQAQTIACGRVFRVSRCAQGRIFPPALLRGFQGRHPASCCTSRSVSPCCACGWWRGKSQKIDV